MPRFIYTVINFLLLLLIIYLVGRKMIVNIFRGRREKINQDLDVINEPLPEAEVYDPLTSGEEGQHQPALDEELAVREKKLSELKEKFEHESEILRRESLLNSRSNLVQLTMDKAREYMKSEEFLQSMKDQEDKVADRILSLIKLTPGDMMYLEKKGRLYVSLFSSYPLKLTTIGRIHQATDKLLEDVGGITSFRIVDDEEGLIGGFRLRIGDTVYDYTVKDRLYMLQEALNDMPLKETTFEATSFSVYAIVYTVNSEDDATGQMMVDADGIDVGRAIESIEHYHLLTVVGEFSPRVFIILLNQPVGEFGRIHFFIVLAHFLVEWSANDFLEHIGFTTAERAKHAVNFIVSMIGQVKTEFVGGVNNHIFAYFVFVYIAKI